MGMNEQSTQSSIIKYLEKEGHYVSKIIRSSKAGTPDLLVCLKGSGRFVALEVKRPKGGVVSPLQKHHIGKIQEAGGIAAVVRSVDDVKETLASL
jgi:hypothetical protein